MKEGERRPFAFYPPLVALFPVLAIYSANVGLFPLAELWRPVGLALAAGIVGWLALSALRLSFEKGALVASILFTVFWAFRPTLGQFEWASRTFWYVFVAAAIGGWWWSTRRNLPTQILNRFALLLVIVASVTIGARAHTARTAAFVPEIQHAGGRPPDVFYILLDGYGRADQLSKVFGYDNGEFVRALEARGFFLPADSHSNYCQTGLSLSSILNMDTVQNLLPDIPRTHPYREPLNELVNRPKIVRELRTRGFDTVAVATGFPAFTFDGFDMVISSPPPISYFETFLVERTPFDLPGDVVESQFNQRRETLALGFGALQNLARPTAKPRFVFAHILAPHPPFVYRPDGSPADIQKTFAYWDGSDFMTFAGTPATYRQGYIDQLQWVNRQVLKTVDALLNTSGQKPIIVLQGDHGSKLGLDQNDIAKTDLDECFGALGAYYVGPTIRERLDDKTTPLRAIQAIYQFITGRPGALAEDRSYYSGFATPYDFTDVTQRLR